KRHTIVKLEETLQTLNNTSAFIEVDFIDDSRFEDSRLQHSEPTAATFLKLFRPTAENTKEITNREKFSSSFAAYSVKSISTLTSSSPSSAISGQSLLKSLESISEILANSEWVLLLQEGALLADPLNANPFSQKLDAFSLTNQNLILFEHCNQTNSGSLLIHNSFRDRISGFVKSYQAQIFSHEDFSVWRELLKTFKTTLSKLPGNDLFTCELFWLEGDVDLANFNSFTVDDRISADIMRLIADFYFGTMPLPDLMKDSLKYNLVIEIPKDSDVTKIVVRDGSVIFVDSWSIVDFVDKIAPQIKTRYVLLSGDGDGCGPECYLHPVKTKLYIMNCQGVEAGNGKISCLPIGLSEWHDSREMMHRAYQQGIGLRNGLVWKPVNLLEKSERYVLASFNVKSNPKARQPVFDLFCNSSKSDIAKVMNCQFGEVDQLTFYSKVMAKSRFVISPHGNGLDCYRTYEALFMNVIPIVVKSSLDALYEELPVLTLDKWEDLTIELMENTESNFAKMKWNLRKLYSDYWYHKVRTLV
ncbi:hypothetical protein HK100_007756, partial [Physocladia obscura]